ncbi:site-specific integrase [Halovulum dunhuangense]|uniref:Site-specific integrase n=1 Tax=Halovulum dunhuangense TaxID=1505036 RepID=A0A849L7Y8_9RHOB|nr:site-specific integrase [Halovulum dunhuangense]NNU82190.1 site-specific integrase [Halovulum dunhuangense]
MKTLRIYDLSTDEKRRSHPPREAPYWHPLKVNRGIGMRRPELDKAYWVARYRLPNGDYKRFPLGPVAGFSNAGTGGLCYEQALEKALAALSDPAIVSIAAEARDLERRFDLLYCPWGNVYTVGHALADYAEWVRIACAWSHYLGVRTRCNYYLLPHLGQLPAAEMTRERLREFIEAFFEVPAANGSVPPKTRVSLADLDEVTLSKRKRTLNMLIGLLRSALRMAWEDGKIDDERAWRGLRFVPYVKRRRLLYLTRPEVRALIDACDPSLANLVRGALYTGCRASELLKIQVKDVAKDGFGIYVCPVKTYRPRFVFLSEDGMGFFLDLIEGKREEEFVFDTTTGRSYSAQFAGRFKRAVARANLADDFTFHGLRHTYASRLVEAGVAMGVVAEQLGHNGPETVMMTYSHFAPQLRESAVRSYFEPIETRAAEGKQSAGRSVAARFAERHGKEPRDYDRFWTDPNARRINFIRGDVEVARYFARKRGNME